MKFKRGDKVKIRKNVTLEEIANNHFNGCQMDTMKFLLNASFNSFERTFIVREILYDGCVRLNNDFLVNVVVLDKVEEILDDKEKEYLASVIKPFRDKITYIAKAPCNVESEFIRIDLGDDSCILPCFKKNTMYKNMEANKGYTLKELELDE